ncbi:MAG: choice-of-anchor D domain-containing protein [Bradymonadaceae bacterium]
MLRRAAKLTIWLAATVIAVVSLAGCSDAAERPDPFGLGTDSGGADATVDGGSSGGPAPELQAPDRIVFSKTTVGGRSVTSFELHNKGEEPLEVVPSIDERGPDGEAEVKPRTAFPDSIGIPPGGSSEHPIAYEPVNAKPDPATLVLETNDPSLEDGVARIPIEAKTDGRPEFRAPDRVTFVASKVGDTVRKSVEVRNEGKGPLKILEHTFSNSADRAFQLDTAALPDDIDQIPPGESLSFPIEFTPSSEAKQTAELTLDTGDPDAKRHTVELIGRINGCPTASASASHLGRTDHKGELLVKSGGTVRLHGRDSSDSDGKIAEYRWSVIEQPQNANVSFQPSDRHPNPTLSPTETGDYRVELVVVDDDGSESCQRDIVLLNVRHFADIQVRLTWDTPKDSDQTDGPGSDMDLHYLNPKKGSWQDKPADIFWFNRTADWGRVGSEKDDPEMVIDDTDGRGPEVIQHDNPVAGQSYAIGVNYYQPNGFGASYATVEIYAEGRLVRAIRRKRLRDSEFWYIGRLRWPSKHLITRDKVTQGFPNRP